SLRNVENVRRAEADDGLRVAIRCLGFLASNDRREDRDALLALANEPPKLPPGVEACHPRRVGPLPADQADVMEAVAMELRHRLEQRGQAFALPLCERGAQMVQ